MLHLLSNDVIVRAAKTFVQAFLAAWALTGNELSEVALLAGVAAGISAVWNFVIKTA